MGEGVGEKGAHYSAGRLKFNQLTNTILHVHEEYFDDRQMRMPLI